MITAVATVIMAGGAVITAGAAVITAGATAITTGATVITAGAAVITAGATVITAGSTVTDHGGCDRDHGGKRLPRSCRLSCRSVPCHAPSVLQCDLEVWMVGLQQAHDCAGDDVMLAAGRGVRYHVMTA